jgi:hypothetical protein
MMAQGKGDIQRPCDKKKFDEEWERIFGKNDAPAPSTEIKSLQSDTPFLDTYLDMAELRKAMLLQKIASACGISTEYLNDK